MSRDKNANIEAQYEETNYEVATDGGVDEHPTPVTDDNELDDLCQSFFDGGDAVLYSLAYDVQQDIQNTIDLSYDSIEILAEKDNYVVISDPEFWDCTRAEFESDEWSTETTTEIVHNVKNLHLKLAEKSMNRDRLYNILGATDVAVVFAR